MSRYFRCYLSETGNNWATVNSSTGATPYDIVFGFKPQIQISPNLGLVRDNNDLCQSDFCQFLPNHTHVNKKTSHSYTDNLLSSKSSMDLLNRETKFKNLCRKVYRKVREANYRSLAYRKKYKLAKPLRVGQKVLLENHNVPFGKSQKLCELRSGPDLMTKLTMKVNHETALDADLTRTQLVYRNHLVEYFLRDNELQELIIQLREAFQR